jgi:hypothetical protein
MIRWVASLPVECPIERADFLVRIAYCQKIDTLSFKNRWYAPASSSMLTATTVTPFPFICSCTRTNEGVSSTHGGTPGRPIS